MYKKGMRRAAALLAVCWLGLLFRAAAETPAEKLERLRAEQQAIEQQIEQNRTDAARAGDLVNLYTAKEQNVKAQINLCTPGDRRTNVGSIFRSWL